MMKREAPKLPLIIDTANTKERPITWQLITSLFGAKTEKPLKYDSIMIKLSLSEFSRIEVFLDDISDSTDGEYSITFIGLTSILLADFLKQISIGIPLKNLADALMAKQTKYLKPVQSDLRQQSINRWALVESKVPEPRRKYKIISFQIHLKALRRLTVLLMDLSNINPDFSMTIEEVITVLLRDFVHEIRTKDHSEIMSVFVDWLSE
ncbi:hypothetical protein [Paenibacillus periandrae]|uniref:hypothetical protein n=1 Tax=Paenibacillus periandrae TaxID=1761741 RepID=UPI001F08DDE4|nr:hypothetical protein [Paenibacillus periandrae]